MITFKKIKILRIFKLSLFFVLFASMSMYGKIDLCPANLGWGPTSAINDSILVEGFENSNDWQINSLGKEKIKVSSVKGQVGQALHIDYDLGITGRFVYFV